MVIHAVLFDIDGTLLDTREFIYGAIEHALATHGIAPLSSGHCAFPDGSGT